MRKLLFGCIVLSFLFFGERVNAESGCSTITYYSQKDWVAHQNLFDGQFDKGDSHFVNSQGIVVKQNIFGTVAKYNRVDSSVFSGASSYIVTGGQDNRFPTFFSLGFGKVIQIGKIQFQVDAVNTKTNQSVLKKIYINADPKEKAGEMVYSKNRLIQSTSENGLLTIDLKNQLVGSIEIFFETDDKDHEYIMRSFQILDYKILEHVGWVSEKIENTESKNVFICANQGEFKPNGTNAKWVQRAATSFKPSSKTVSDYRPIVEARDVTYDIGKTDAIAPYSTPNIQKWMGGYTSKIEQWQKITNQTGFSYQSIGPKGEEFPYIETAINRGIVYVATPRFWSSSRQTTYFVKSFDPDWCNDVTGSRHTPCYKRDGHTSNNRLNLYDVDIVSYRNVVNPELRAIKSTSYTLVNELTGTRKLLTQGGDELKSFVLNETGVWRIESTSTDLANNKGIKKSAPFMIDNQKPEALIYALSTDYTKPFKVGIIPYDKHSRVKKWSYSISQDGGSTYEIHEDNLVSKREQYLIQGSGDYVVKVYVEDWAGNTNIITSTLYPIRIDSARIETVLVSTYEVGQPTQIHMKLQCGRCEITPQVVKVSRDKQTLFESEVKNKDEEFIVEFIPTQANQTQLHFQFEQQKADLLVYEKSREFKETSEEQIEFKGIVASGFHGIEQQRNYVETLLVQYHQDQNQIFSGQGIESKVTFNYGNECARIVNFTCMFGDETTLQKGSVQMQYQDSADGISDDYREGDSYLVQLLEIEEPQEFVLPHFYVEKQKGTVRNQKEEGFIDGGRKWYTHPLAQVQTYPIVVVGNGFGLNEFNWRSHHAYLINAHYYDTYQLRFVETKNPFPNRESRLWRQQELWFKELDKEQSIHQETFK